MYLRHVLDVDWGHAFCHAPKHRRLLCTCILFKFVISVTNRKSSTSYLRVTTFNAAVAQMASFIHGHILSEKYDALNITPMEPQFKEGILISKLTVTAIVNFFSVIGAGLIIVSYMFFKNVRTKGRLVLLHISLADLGISLSNFVGAVFFFNRHQDETHCSPYDNSNWSESCRVVDALCKTQAFFAAYCTLASFFWTPTLAVYVYLLITDPSRTLSTGLVRFAYVFCWGLPLLISLWLMFTWRLGDTGFGGWCSLIVETADGSISTFVVIFASNLYVVTTFVVVLVLYTATHCYLRLRVSCVYASTVANYFAEHELVRIILLASYSVLIHVRSIWLSVQRRLSVALLLCIYCCSW